MISQIPRTRVIGSLTESRKGPRTAPFPSQVPSSLSYPYCFSFVGAPLPSALRRSLVRCLPCSLPQLLIIALSSHAHTLCRIPLPQLLLSCPLPQLHRPATLFTPCPAHLPALCPLPPLPCCPALALSCHGSLPCPFSCSSPSRAFRFVVVVLNYYLFLNYRL